MSDEPEEHFGEGHDAVDEAARNERERRRQQLAPGTPDEITRISVWISVETVFGEQAEVTLTRDAEERPRMREPGSETLRLTIAEAEQRVRAALGREHRRGWA